MKEIKIAPSILSADFSKLGEEVKALEKAGADMIHVDVMDGHFVPNISIGPLVVEAVKRVTSCSLDVHLMISNPDEFIPEFAKKGADIISVHVETCVHLNRTISLISSLGVIPAVALNPATPLGQIEYIMEEIGMVLIMTVNPGFGGQKFIESTLRKIEQLKTIRDKNGYQFDIEVDGGIKLSTIEKVANAGANVFVSGTGILNTENYANTISMMREKVSSLIK